MSNTPVFRWDRRMFLRGAGGAVLALPLLPSLLSPREAKAQAAWRPKSFVHFRTPHGAIFGASMWPGDPALTQSLFYADHDVRRGDLAATAQANGDAVISRVLTAKSSVLTPTLISKMNILRGLDFPLYMGHNFGAPLGYYDFDKQRPGSPRATIDQVMAYSPAFYPSVASVRKRSVAIAGASTSTGSWGYNTPGVRSSGVASSAIGGTESSLALFDTLLAGSSSPGTARTPVVDKVLESYRRLRNGNSRLSAEDKGRLDQHIDAVAELQRRLETTSTGCQVPARPTTDNLSLRNSSSFAGDPAKNVEYFRLINEVLAVAMNCGVCRVATISIDEHNQNLTFTPRAPQGEDWHNNVVHPSTVPGANQDLVVQFNQVFFSQVFLDLVSRFERFSNGAGGTLLDDSLLAWGQENGNTPHFSFSVPVVTAGSAGGALKTGNYCDYRNITRKVSGDSSTGSEGSFLWSGLLYNQWLGTALQAMGIPQAEWSETDHSGYGWKASYQSTYEYLFTNKGFSSAQAYPAVMWQKAGELLPFLSP
ncbi:DUF1552 domain-containing protein [Myxococcus llanfairpwllgwyngyllgogerychwyrndrobwllllantysiliogogogochensis]|uniref:DUF1552 domain-containing protein n=1 Tax=Myxococcus llanfairpwllgwyngyllgogerychwyrndrobwllllantysiliogogogochensis TaxID=2590453 RepID=A0A540X659_9BACT|nr:DUF1552 domain-containing protein [Myxococcus llanfairpwllgwyngyllgogerychwyrndrobwllllantysiliogogogochensis]TQF16214.1 DUF1552 domain-containing protein [Myxococcus llanfairpwllgwyngyllgogerychwyrndrobwllllantysiliogogogochensis]